MTGAPLVADGVILTGISGAEFGTRLFIDGWDAQTGQHLWRTYTIPGPGEPGNETWPGDTWQHGGSTWITFALAGPRSADDPQPTSDALNVNDLQQRPRCRGIAVLGDLCRTRAALHRIAIEPGLVQNGSG